MMFSSSSPPIRRRPGEGRGPRGFTLVELVAVVLILAFLIALLLPALSGAMKTARNAAVGAEINQLAQALASFKAQYGDYPPSRILLAEDGNYNAVTSNQTLSIAGRAISPGATGTEVRRGAPQVFPECELQYLGSGVVGTTANPPASGTTSTATDPRRALYPPGSRVPGVLPGRYSADHRAAPALE